MDYLVTLDLPLCVIFEVSISLKAPFHHLSELDSERLRVKQMMHAEARAGRLARIRRADAFLRRSDAGGRGFVKAGQHGKRAVRFIPGAAELDLFEAVDDLVEVKNKSRAIRHE